MTFEQAVVTLGRPKKQVAVAAGTEYHWTRTEEKRLPPSTRLIGARPRPPDSVMKIEVPVAIAVVKDGVIVEVR